MDGLVAVIKAASIWSQSAHFGFIANSNFYILLFIPLGMIIMAYLLRPRTKRMLPWFFVVLDLALFPAIVFILCVGATLLPGVTLR